MNPPQAPLAGIRIVAVEQYGAGPYGTLYLADMGAEIIKIEDPGTGGDIARYVPPGQEGTDSLFFESFNRGKRSLALDLKNPSGRAVLERLVAQSHVVFNNLRGDLPERMQLTYASLGKINPAIICASLSAYGRTGPRASYPGYDALVQAEAGWASLTGEPGGPPSKSGLSLADYAAGLTAGLAIMVALFDAQRTGQGRDVDTSLYDVALALLTYPAAWYLSAGITTERHPLSGHPSMVPFQFIETADGYLALACPKEKFFQDLTAIIELPELATDPQNYTTAEWIEQLQGRVPCAPVRSLADALDREELEARNMLASYDHRTFGQVQMIGTPFTLEGFQPEYRPAPALNGDQSAILDELGYSEDEFAALRAAGAFGSP